MLVLCRRPQEHIILPTIPVVVKVLAIQAGMTRLGILAPQAVPIFRGEAHRRGCSEIESLLSQTIETTEDNLATDCHSLELSHSAEEKESPNEQGQPLDHVIRECLNDLVLGIELLQRQFPDPQTVQDFVVRNTLTGLENVVKVLRQNLVVPSTTC